MGLFFFIQKTFFFCFFRHAIFLFFGWMPLEGLFWEVAPDGGPLDILAPDCPQHQRVLRGSLLGLGGGVHLDGARGGAGSRGTCPEVQGGQLLRRHVDFVVGVGIFASTGGSAHPEGGPREPAHTRSGRHVGVFLSCVRCTLRRWRGGRLDGPGVSVVKRG